MEHLTDIDYLVIAREIMRSEYIICEELDALINRLKSEREESDVCSSCNGDGRVDSYDYTGQNKTGTYPCPWCKGSGKNNNM